MAIAAYGVLFGAGTLMIHYLRDEERKPDGGGSFDATQTPQLLRTIDLLEAKTRLLQNTASPLDPESSAELAKTIGDSIRSTINEDFVNSMEEKFGNENALRIQHDSVRSLCDETKRRLERELEALSRRSNINLVIGVLTTLMAVGLLAYIALSSTVDKTDLTSVLLFFLPRLSVVIFIEIFSFFFLRLYKSGLQDIKYYQNELTTVETSYIALQSALIADLPQNAVNILHQLCSDDRNRITNSSSSDKNETNFCLLYTSPSPRDS